MRPPEAAAGEAVRLPLGATGWGAPRVTLKARERERLYELEVRMEHGLEGFREVGRALLEISDTRLYRLRGYATFAEYVRHRWDISRSYAYRQMEAAKVVQVLEDAGEPLPANEAQARELLPLANDPEHLLAAWRAATALHGAGLTARALRGIVAAHRGSERHPGDVAASCPRCGYAWGD